MSTGKIYIKDTQGNVSELQVEPKAHNQASNTITAMTGYAKSSAAGAIATTDSLNDAIGKLEKGLDTKQATLSAMTATEASAGTANTARTITAKVLNDKIADYVDTQGYLTEITKEQVTTALGYTPPTTNTTYAAGTTALLNTGAETTAKIWSAKAIADYVIGKGYITTYTNTTYAAGTTALLDTGTETTAKVWSAKAIADYVTGKGYITTYTNTTYAAGTAALLTTGTDTTNRVWQAKIIADYVNGKIPTIPNLSVTSSGTGNAITNITVSGHQITFTKGTTFPTSVPTIPNLSITTSGSGNAITAITVSNHAITATKGTSFYTTAGGNITGDLAVVKAASTNANAFITVNNGVTGEGSAQAIRLAAQYNGNSGVYDVTNSKWLVLSDTDGNPITLAPNNTPAQIKIGNGGTVGSASQPIYLNGGVLTAGNSIPSIPNLSVTSSGTGNVISNITVSGHTITFTKGVTALTAHQNLSVTNSGTGNAVTAITVSGHAITVTKGASYLGSTAKAVSATTADKLGTATVGDGNTPIYLSAGSPTKLTATIGTASKPIWLSAGSFVACSATVGSVNTPVYLNGGAITSCGNKVEWYGHPFGWGTPAKTAGATDTANASMIYFQYVN